MLRTLVVAGLMLYFSRGAFAAESVELVQYPALGGQTLSYRIAGDANAADPEAPGNGNSCAEPGEILRLVVLLRNVGKTDLEGVTLTLRVKDSQAATWAHFLQAEHDYGALAAGAVTSLAAPHSHILEIAPSAPAPGVLELECLATWKGGPAQPVRAALSIPVRRVPTVDLQIGQAAPLAPGDPCEFAVSLPKERRAGLSRVRVLPLPEDFEVRISPASLEDLETTDGGTFRCEAAPILIAQESTVTLAVSATCDGALYRWRKTVAVPLRPKEPRADLYLWTLADVFIEQFGRPMTRPHPPAGGPAKGGKFPVPDRSYKIEVVSRRPATVPPPLEIRQGEGDAGRIVAPGYEVKLGDGPLYFGWKTTTRHGWSIRVSIREDSLVFELSPVPADMVYIPEGKFEMGTDEPDAGSAAPRHAPLIGEFGMDVYEVARGQYAAFLADPAAKSHAHCHGLEHALAPDKDHTPLGWNPAWNCMTLNADEWSIPVTGVDWFDAYAYANWAGKRLPTEAQWERAAAGPGRPNPYPWGAEADLQNLSNVGRIRPGPMKVGQCFRDRTPEGIFDLGGNVAEWCQDWYGQDYYASSPAVDPQGPDAGVLNRVIRGASWDMYGQRCRCHARDSADPLLRFPFVGFRCVVTPAK